MSRRVRVLGLFLGAFAMFALVACADDNGNGDGGITGDPPATAADGGTDGDANGGNDAGDNGDTGGDGGPITVGLTEFAIDPSASSASAGDVTFEATNDGALPHELIVIRTDLGPTELPMDGAQADLDADGVEVVDETDEFDAGTSESLTVNLDAGSYVLTCGTPPPG
ncbi:MAG: hypothetical protein WD800_07455 [Dehalococcoidia bacterium]